ncbi:MAG: hypothetical protein E7652_02700 [Ruminococcaceae bacterium]|nr:hypothetical protein [Oscillospiraceae bacterium]
MDWNGDGKHDSRDDAFYHNVINKDNGNKGGGEPPSSGGGCMTTIAVDILALAYLGALLPGDIPVNTFTMIIGFVCLGRLIYSFFRWVYS